MALFLVVAAVLVELTGNSIIGSLLAVSTGQFLAKASFKIRKFYISTPGTLGFEQSGMKLANQLNWITDDWTC